MTEPTNENRVVVPTTSTPEEIAARFDRYEAGLARRREAVSRKKEPSPQFNYVPGNGQE